MNLVPNINPQSVASTQTRLVYYNPYETGFGVFMSPEQAQALAAKKILAEKMAAYISDLRERGA
jgi:hypothetical protein